MTDRRFDRIADDFLSSGPTVLPDRVLDAAFEEVHRTRQRRALWLAPWRFPTMNTFAKFAVAAVAVIAVGVLGLTFLNPDQGGVGGVPSVAPSATVAPTATPVPTPTPAPTPPALTGEFTSPSHGYTIAVPEGWSTRPATAPWTTEFADYFSASADIVSDEASRQGFLAVASQPLGDRTRAEWEADVWRIVLVDGPENAACPSQTVPITVDGAPGVVACDLVLVTSGGRGYWIRDFLGDDPPWGSVLDRAFFDSMLATMKLHPEDAVDEVASPAPS
jgi:hypothetical protein